MTRVLLTGGSGFMATHILETLLVRGHSVVTTVRSADKGKKIVETHPKYGRDKLDFVIVQDISKADAFESAVMPDPPFEAVIHTASPYHFNAKTEEEVHEMIDTATNGTIGIMKAIKSKAPTVKRVVITSSMASIIDANKPPTYIYSEADWNPVTADEALKSPIAAYWASKTFAERAAWDFIDKEKPGFELATCNPPVVLGPVMHDLKSLDSLNTSNQRFGDFITGAAKEKCPPTGMALFVDVRDIALAHVLAMEKPGAAGKRFFIVRDKYCNREIVDLIAEEFPEYKDMLPSGDALKPGEYPEEGVYGFNNQRSVDILGLEYRPLKESVVDVVKSLQPFLKN